MLLFRLLADETYIFTAGKKVTQDGLEYWKWDGTLYHVAFTTWFPGNVRLFVWIANANLSTVENFQCVMQEVRVWNNMPNFLFFPVEFDITFFKTTLLQDFHQAARPVNQATTQERTALLCPPIFMTISGKFKMWIISSWMTHRAQCACPSFVRKFPTQTVGLLFQSYCHFARSNDCSCCYT